MNAELGAAIARMDAALELVEAAMDRHFDTDRRRSDLEVELQVMGEDRARLATELESATARLARVQTASDHVGLRLDAAIGTIQAVLDGSEREPGLDGAGLR